MTSEDHATTATLAEARVELAGLRATPVAQWKSGAFNLRAGLGERNLWLVAENGTGGGFAVRAASAAGGKLVLRHGAAVKPGRVEFELTCDLGAHRVRVETARRGPDTMLHVTTFFLPVRDYKVESSARDVYAIGSGGDPLESVGKVHAAQRGLRSGLAYGSGTSQPRASLLYFQNFTELADYFEHTRTTPADTVGGTWPELGYAAPHGGEPLRASHEYVVSDAYLVLSNDVPATESAAAEQYLDMLAQVYLAIRKPEVEYHHWPAKAHETVLHLSHSPKCTYRRQGMRFFTPYVGDETKPPESMVQLVVLLALMEYRDWSGEEIPVIEEIQKNISVFFDPELETMVRWLPGERFAKRQDPNQNHRAMDSWYLYHILFNLTRLAKRGDATAKSLLERSLPYAMRVARRFSYRWPVFFDLATLDVVRDVAGEGRGGENDVAGLYALTMLHAHEIFGSDLYLQEAKAAAEALEGLGFTLAYQMNTTLFGAEAMLRLFLETGEERYRGLSEICLANAFNNVWLWECEYGFAQCYHTFFGLFPLQDAPYFAAYEELEALAKFREYFRLAGDTIRPSLRLLMAEYCKNLLQRAHYYFPSSLPGYAIAKKSQNGAIERSIEVPLEDLQDGRSESGKVGQETYGAGLALVCATRHYLQLPDANASVFCDYPVFGFKPAGARGANGRRETSYEFHIEGDERATCTLRLIPAEYGEVPSWSLRDARGKTVEAKATPEGHVAFSVAGNQRLTLSAKRRSASG